MDMQRGICEHKDHRNTPHRRITACTSILTSGNGNRDADVGTLLNRGLAYLDIEDYHSALSDFERVVQLNSRSQDGYYNRGIAYTHLGELDRAIADFDVVIRLAPRQPIYYFARGAANQKKFEYELAIADYDQALHLQPRYVDVLVNRSTANIHLERYSLALADLDDVIRRQPNNARALGARCWARSAWGQQLDLALSDCSRSVTLEDTAYARNLRGLAHLRRGEFREACDDYESALRMNPESGSSLFGRGIARLRLGLAVEGAADIANAAKIDAAVTAQFAKYGVVP